ncbi:methyl-accepting chemotaxis protein [Paenibacillus radicis (ex Xue et al. 2023)]|uniref:Methyl-accepting chemotaxis protein n=1 Tax=Paenibacillus radicis (ex Xue et al. 2023) TaxID=2972489 RepID=A0ABT1YFC3_9BACL|nr:methyl-accepting chemotaxis protein [Paenibacillus radicis (ex Xue et al. 2023)]MCR8630928.1 methyl-accepting chemotaxis protein [Paenibacillus radicis (ex Xue et al. 2023)]
MKQTMNTLLRKMSKRPSMTLRMKLLLGFSGMLILFLAVALYNLQQVHDIKEHLNQQNDKVELKLMALELKEMVQELNIIASGLEISKKIEYIPKYNEKRKIYDGMIKRIGETATTPEQAKWRSKLISLTGDYTNTFDVAAKLIQENNLPPKDLDTNMEYLYNESQKLMGDIFINVDQFYVAYSHDAELAVASTQDLLNSTVTVMLIASVFVIFFSIAIALLLIRSFISPIKRLQQAVQSIAAGDLRFKINSSSKDELGALSSSFDQMIDQVRSMLANTQGIASYLSEHSNTFRSFSGSTAAANADILRAIKEISNGADQQASQSEQSSYIIAELEQEIIIISEFIQIVQNRSREAAFNTHAGSTSMEALKLASGTSEAILEKVYRAMEGLSSSTTQINKIVNTISDISHQTNVLAINAAIEAARAGVHGRGFSVIAEEVRHLSAQTNESSKMISSIISSLLAQTKDLESYFGDARKSFDQQNSKMGESMEAFGQIRGSMDELSVQIDHIQQQITQAKSKNGQLVESVQYVAAIAQETAAGVEEVSAAASQQDSAIHQIAAQADDILMLSQKLFEEINKFQIGDLDEMSSDPINTEHINEDNKSILEGISSQEGKIESEILEHADTPRLTAEKDPSMLQEAEQKLESSVKAPIEHSKELKTAPGDSSDKKSEAEAKKEDSEEKKLITVG